jgi:hypothetical protein
MGNEGFTTVKVNGASGPTMPDGTGMTRVRGGVPDQRACAKADSGSGQLDCGWEEDQAICHTPAPPCTAQRVP